MDRCVGRCDGERERRSAEKKNKKTPITLDARCHNQLEKRNHGSGRLCLGLLSLSCGNKEKRNPPHDSDSETETETAITLVLYERLALSCDGRRVLSRPCSAFRRPREQDNDNGPSLSARIWKERERIERRDRERGGVETKNPDAALS